MQLDKREFRAEAKFQRVSPQKARLVLDLIKGLPVEQALNVILFTKKGVAPLVEKVLRSALQNANYLSGERGLDIDVDQLYVKSAIANEGPRMKRIRPAPMGRAFRYQRRMAHIIISVAEVGENAGVGGIDAGETKRIRAGKADGKRSTRTVGVTDRSSGRRSGSGQGAAPAQN